MKKRSGQVSVEYMLILGLAFMIMVPAGYLFYTFSQGNQDTLVSAQVVNAGSEIMGRVQEMYAVGQNSWSTVSINFPEAVTDIYLVGDQELVIEYNTQNGPSQAVFFSSIDMTTPYPGGNVSMSFQPGFTKIKVTSLTSEVLVEEVT